MVVVGSSIHTVNMATVVINTSINLASITWDDTSITLDTSIIKFDNS